MNKKQVIYWIVFLLLVLIPFIISLFYFNRYLILVLTIIFITIILSVDTILFLKNENWKFSLIPTIRAFGIFILLAIIVDIISINPMWGASIYLFNGFCATVFVLILTIILFFIMKKKFKK